MEGPGDRESGPSSRDPSYWQSPLADLQKDDSRLRRLFDSKVLPSMMLQALVFGMETTAVSYGLVYADDERRTPWVYAAPFLLQIPLQVPIAWFINDSFPVDKFSSAGLCICACLFSVMGDAGATGFLIGRVFQGLFESGILLPLVLVTQIYWKGGEVPLRMACWFSMTGMANIVMSVLTYLAVTSQFRGPHLLLILSYTCILIGIYSFFLFVLTSNSPMQLKFLSDREEKSAWGLGRLSAPRSCDWNQDHVYQAINDRKTWLWVGLIFLTSVSIGGINSLSPVILKSLGVGSSRILLNVPFGIMQVSAIIGSGIAATKYRIGGTIISLCLVSAMGFVMLAMGSSSSPTSLLAGYCLIAATHGIAPLIYSWAGLNTAGTTKKKVTVAFVFMSQALGNIVGPFVFCPSPGESMRPHVPWISFAVHALIVGLVIVGSGHIQGLNTQRVGNWGKRLTDMGGYYGNDARLHSILDIDRMQTPEGAYALREDSHGLPYLFKSRVWEGLTDMEDNEVLFNM